MFCPIRSSEPVLATVEMDSRDVYKLAGAVSARTHISMVKADVPNAVEGTSAAVASAALLRRMLPAGAVHGADGEGDGLTDADSEREGGRVADCDDDRDALRERLAVVVALPAIDIGRDCERDAD